MVLVEYWAKSAGYNTMDPKTGKRKPKMSAMEAMKAAMMAKQLAKTAEDAKADREAAEAEAIRAAQEAAAAEAEALNALVVKEKPKRKHLRVYKQKIYPPIRSWSVDMWLHYMSGLMWDHEPPSDTRYDKDRHNLHLADGYQRNLELESAWQEASMQYREAEEKASATKLLENKKATKLSDDKSAARVPDLHLSAAKPPSLRGRAKAVDRLSYFNPSYDAWAASLSA